MQVTVAYSPAPRETFERVLNLAAGATAHEAVIASGLPEAYPSLDWQAMTPGVWGKAVGWDRRLEEADRVELCRPLTVDPKVARRERFRQQGARGTGLFKK